MVLTGEYAVLRGAPALVMSVNRFATCRCSLSPAKAKKRVGKGANKDQTGWRFASQGFVASSQHPLEQLSHPERLANDDPARLCAYVLQAYQQHPAGTRLDLPDNLLLELNSAQMYHAGAKLGLGSSAALTVALLGVVHQLAQGALGSGQKPAQGPILNAEIDAQLGFEIAQSAHRASQGGVGSGLDIATSLNGGVIRFDVF